MIIYSYDLDMVPGGYRTEVWLNQYDEDFTLVFNLFAQNGTFTVQEGTTAAIRGTKPDGNGFSADATISGTTVTVTGDKQITAVAGKASFELTLYKNEKELNTANFTIQVERAALDKDTVISGSQTRELVEIEDNAAELIAAAQQAADAQTAIAATAQDVAADSAAAIAAKNDAETALNNINANYNTYLGNLEDKYEQTMQAMDDKSESIAQIVTDADDAAQRALEKAAKKQTWAFVPFELPSAYTGTYTPVMIYSDGAGNYITDFTADKFKVEATENNQTIYVTTIGNGGTASKSGQTRETAKNLYGALRDANNGDTIIVQEGIYDVADLGSILTANYWNKSINLIGEGSVIFLFGGVAFKHSASKTYDSENDLWRCTRGNTTQVIDASLRFRLPKTSSLEACKATEESWFLDNTTNYVYINSKTEPDVFVMQNTYGIQIDPTSNRRMYFENIYFVGGLYNVKINATDSTNSGLLETIWNNCQFLFAKAQSAASAYNGFYMCSGHSLCYRCRAEFSDKDGFGYTPGSNNVEMQFVEIECVGANNGLSQLGDTDNCNGSTCHSGTRGIRVNGLYYNNWGGNIADVQEGTQTINLGCIANDSCGTGMNHGISAQQEGTTMWLYNCSAHNNTQDIYCKTGATMYIHDCDYTVGAMNGTVSISGGNFIEIEDDLDDYKQEGEYVFIHTASLPQNCPLPSNCRFILKVMRINSYCLQEIHSEIGIYARRGNVIAAEPNFTAWEKAADPDAGSVTTEKLAQGSVTEEKLGQGAVTMEKLGGDEKNLVEELDIHANGLDISFDGPLPGSNRYYYGDFFKGMTVTVVNNNTQAAQNAYTIIFYDKSGANIQSTLVDYQSTKEITLSADAVKLRLYCGGSPIRGSISAPSATQYFSGKITTLQSADSALQAADSALDTRLVKQEEKMSSHVGGVNLNINAARSSSGGTSGWIYFDTYFYKGLPVTIEHTRSDSATNTLQPHFYRADGTQITGTGVSQISPNTTVTFTMPDTAERLGFWYGNYPLTATVTAPSITTNQEERLEDLEGLHLDSHVNGLNVTFDGASEKNRHYYADFYKGMPITIVNNYDETIDGEQRGYYPTFYDKNGNVTLGNIAVGYHTTKTIIVPADSVHLNLYCGGSRMRGSISAPPLGHFLNDTVSSLTSTDIVSLNRDVVDLLRNAKQAICSRGRTPVPPLCLFHFSDPHGMASTIDRMVQMKHHLGDAIDDTICTGDLVVDDYEDGMAFWNGVSGSEDILLCMGNHDLHADGSTDYEHAQKTQAEAWTQYFAPYISNWGVSYTQGNTYYYKDYATQGIRLIVLNYLLTGDEATAQNSWLQARLTEAKTGDLTVVIAIHTHANGQTIPCGFSVRNKNWSTSILSQSLLQSVQDFIDGGGHFACWLTGHTHADRIATAEDFSDQLFITVTIASPNSLDGDQRRVSGDISQDAANLTVIDTETQTIKLIRIGANRDAYLRGRHMLTISYANKQVIAQE